MSIVKLRHYNLFALQYGRVICRYYNDFQQRPESCPQTRASSNAAATRDLRRSITLSGHFFGATAFLCNEGHYQSWPADVRAAVDAAAPEATALQRRLAAAEDTEILGKLDPHENEVIHPTDAERSAFLDAVQPVLETYRKEVDPKLFAYLGEA